MDRFGNLGGDKTLVFFFRVLVFTASPTSLAQHRWGIRGGSAQPLLLLRIRHGTFVVPVNRNLSVVSVNFTDKTFGGILLEGMPSDDHLVKEG
jgi:hypothetical protein